LAFLVNLPKECRPNSKTQKLAFHFKTLFVQSLVWPSKGFIIVQRIVQTYYWCY